MSITLSATISDNATPAIEAKLAKCAPSRLDAILGPGLKTFVQDRLIANGTNQRGWPTTHFYADAARGTSWQATGNGLVITISKIGIRQRYYGGPITPVNKEALALPISPISYGHVPSDFPGLFLLKTKTGAYLVQYGEAVSAPSAKGRGGSKLKQGAKLGGNTGRWGAHQLQTRLRASLNFLFKLSAGVNQAGDKTIIPNADEMMEVAMTLVTRAVN